jgi:hypothetical protein
VKKHMLKKIGDNVQFLQKYNESFPQQQSNSLTM